MSEAHAATWPQKLTADLLSLKETCQTAESLS
jgi:hypothetical protein